MSRKFYTHVDFNGQQLLQAVLHNTVQASGNTTEGAIIYDTSTKKAYFRNNTGWVDMSGGNSFTIFSDGTNTSTADQNGDTFKFRSANSILTAVVTNDDATHGDNILFTINQGNIDHNSLANLTTGDVHTQYLHLSNSRTVTAAHTWNGTQTFAAAPAFTIATGTNPFSVTSTTKVTNLNADMVDGAHASATPTANMIPIADGSNKLAAGWIQEVIGLVDLSDVATKTGTGTTVVMSTNPSLTNPTLVASGGISLDAGAGRLTNLATPTQGTDAATMAYVDAAVQGLSTKAPVKAATTANIANLAGGAPNTVDGYTVAVNDRILVKNQTTQSQNGIYTVQTVGTGANGTWVRASDADSAAELKAGNYYFVDNGTINGDTGWTLTSDVTTLGTTAVVFTQFNGAGSYTATNVNTAGQGVYKQRNGNSFEFYGINAASTKLSVALTAGTNTIDLDVNEGNISINNLNGTLGVGKGGTGATTLSGIKSNLGYVTRYTTTVGGTGPWTISHNLGSSYVAIEAYTTASPYESIELDEERTDSNTVTLRSNVTFGAGAITVVIIG